MEKQAGTITKRKPEPLNNKNLNMTFMFLFNIKNGLSPIYKHAITTLLTSRKAYLCAGQTNIIKSYLI